jgi:pullulanase
MHQDVFGYYRSLISLRKNHPAFSMPESEMVREALRFTDHGPGMVSFTIDGRRAKDSWSEIMVCYNANTGSRYLKIDGEWQIAVSGDQINESGLGTVKGEARVFPQSMLILFRNQD